MSQPTRTSYLDHAATTPMRSEVIAAVADAMAHAGNPSSLHGTGRAARRRVEESRETLAAAVGARPSEVIFTAGGTESDNLAVKGIFWARRDADPRRTRVVVSAVEHHAVLDAADWLAAHEGAQVSTIEVDRYGTVTAEALTSALGPDPSDVALISVMSANNEVGTLQPIEALVHVADQHGIPMHSDAVQAAATQPLDFAASGMAALSLTGHKLGGPSAAGALLLRRDVACTPLQHGGGQERDVRSGTIDVAGAVGLALAVRVAVDQRAATAARMAALRDDFEARVLAAFPDTVVNGHPTRRLPGTSHLTFTGCDGDALLMLLDAQGVECSTGSACSAGVAQPSHVLLAMGCSADAARGALRFSFGHDSTPADVTAAVDALIASVARARQARLAAAMSGAMS